MMICDLKIEIEKDGRWVLVWQGKNCLKRASKSAKMWVLAQKASKARVLREKKVIFECNK